MEHTANFLNPNKGLINSFLKLFSMLEFCLIDDRYKVEAADIRWINCKKEAGLYLGNSTSEETITTFVLNAILHNMGMLCIIWSNEEIKYEIDESNHQDWLNNGTWYNTAICSRLHGSLFEDFIAHARSDRYNLLCYLALDVKKTCLWIWRISIGDGLITKHVTTEALEALGDTLNLIEI